MSCKILAVNQRSTIKDFVDIGEMITNKVPLENGCAGALALARTSRIGEQQLDLSALKEDLKSKPFGHFLSTYDEITFTIERKDYVEILKNTALALDLDKVYKKRITTRNE